MSGRGRAPAGKLRVLITGGEGQLGRDLAAVFSGAVPDGGRATEAVTVAHDVVAPGHRQLDVSDRSAVLNAFEGLGPQVVVHAAAWTAVDACEGDPERAMAVNALGTRNVAEAARRHGAHMVYLSTDYVFDGEADRPYVEWDTPRPASVYGRSKLAGERECDPSATVVRTSWVCGAHGSNMVKTALRLASGGGPLRFVDDQRGCPTFAADLAVAVAVLSRDRMPGVFHVTNQGPTTWFEFVRAILDAAGADPDRVEPIATADLHPPRPAPRPANSVLDNAALHLAGLPLLPDWHDALDRLIAALPEVSL